MLESEEKEEKKHLGIFELGGNKQGSLAKVKKKQKDASKLAMKESILIMFVCY